MEVIANPGSAFTYGPPSVLQSDAQLDILLSQPGTYTIILTNVTSQNSTFLGTFCFVPFDIDIFFFVKFPENFYQIQLV